MHIHLDSWPQVCPAGAVIILVHWQQQKLSLPIEEVIFIFVTSAQTVNQTAYKQDKNQMKHYCGLWFSLLLFSCLEYFVLTNTR